MKADLRAELRFRNNRLWHAIFAQHVSVAAFCAQYGLNQSIVGRLLNLAGSPYRIGTGKIVQLRRTAQRLCEICQCEAEELFPSSLYSGAIPTKVARELDSQQFQPLTAAQALQLPASSVEESSMQQEMRTALSKALRYLSPREEKILKLRFGLTGEGELTLREIGDHFGLSAARVRQLEERALKKLRRPKTARPLRPFAEEAEWLR